MNSLFARAVLLALALLVTPAFAQVPPLTWSAELGFSLEVPPAWEVSREVPGRGLAMRPPGGGAWPVELAVWSASVGVRDAADVAREHERILQKAVRYERTRIQSIRTEGAGEGVYVVGVVTDRAGEEAASLFAAFLREGRGYAIGTFVEPAALEGASEAYLHPVLQRFRLKDLVTTEPTADRTPAQPEPEETPPEPRHTTADESPTLVPGGEASPGEGPEAPPPLTDRREPLPPVAGPEGRGLSLALPAGWEYETLEHVVVASSPTGLRAYMAPVQVSGDHLGAAAAIDLLHEVLAEDAGASLGSATVLARGVAGLWLHAAIDYGRKPFEALFALHAEQGNGILTGVATPEGSLNADLAQPARLLASLEGVFAGTATPAREERTSTWADESQALACAPPEGWRLEGGVKTYDGVPAIDLRGTSEGGWFTWSHPVRPLFRELSEPMRRLGFRDGDPYYAYEGDDPRLVMTRSAPADLLGRYFLPEGLLPMPAEAATGPGTPIVDPRLLGHADEDAAVVEVRTGRGTNELLGWCVLSQGTIRAERNGRFWEAACLAFGGRPGSLVRAGEALRATIRSTGISEARAPGLATHVRAAAQACAAPFWGDVLGDAPLALCTIQGGPQDPVRTLPGSMSEAWTAVAEGRLHPLPAATGDANNTGR